MRALELDGFLAVFRKEASMRGWMEEELMVTKDGPLWGFSRGGDGAPIYLSAGIHGDEPAGPLAMLEALRAGMFDENRHWMLCPALNPTGLVAGTRENAAGEDLNRDYFRQRTPEVAAHAAWLDSRPCPELFVSLHEDWESSGFYFYEINQGEDRPERAEKVLTAVEGWMPREAASSIDGHETREAGWIYHRADADLPENWPEAIFLAKRGCPLSFTFESPSSKELDARIAAQVGGVKVLLDDRAQWASKGG